MPKYMLRHYEELYRKGIVLYFNGPMSQSIVEGIAQMMRGKMESESAGMKMTQKVFSILVEQMQNIIRYSVDREQAENTIEPVANGQVIVGRDEHDRYYVACGNMIASSDSQRIAENILSLRNLDPVELKRLYKEQRRKGPDAFSKGAGLGFIEMARKSQEPLDFSIVPVNDQQSFFSLKVVA